VVSLGTETFGRLANCHLAHADHSGLQRIIG